MKPHPIVTQKRVKSRAHEGAVTGLLTAWQTPGGPRFALSELFNE